MYFYSNVIAIVICVNIGFVRIHSKSGIKMVLFNLHKWIDSLSIDIVSFTPYRIQDRQGVGWENLVLKHFPQYCPLPCQSREIQIINFLEWESNQQLSCIKALFEHNYRKFQNNLFYLRIYFCTNRYNLFSQSALLKNICFHFTYVINIHS